LTAYLLADVLYEAGLPPAMFQVVTGDPREIADEMLVNPEHRPRHLHRRRRRSASTSPTKAGLSPHGAGAGRQRPADRDGGRRPRRGGHLAAAGSYKNSGQRCTAVKRILVQEKAGRRLRRAKLVAKTKGGQATATRWTPSDRHGDGDRRGSREELRGARERCRRAARSCSCGNVRRQGALYAPTVLDHVPRRLRAGDEETFGPVSPVIRFRDIDDAIRICELDRLRPVVGVCTNRLDYITRFVARAQRRHGQRLRGPRLPHRDPRPSAASRTRAWATRRACRRR
jgi:acyl-CoA reductase-like NAD-dependent aldehyde dehydrogenase